MTQTAAIVAQRNLWPSIRQRVALVVVLLVWIGGVITLEWLIDRPPLEQTISLDPPGAVDTTIWIPLRERYFLLFEFSRQGYSVEQFVQLIGDSASSGMADGVPVALSWSLTSSKTKETVAQGTAVAKGAWAGVRYRLVDTIRVEPGRYQFHAKILDPVPQLAAIPTRLELWNTFKTRDTWQSTTIFWGTLFTTWIVVPVTLFLIGRLIWLASVHYWH